jgi:hypothetical protein
LHKNLSQIPFKTFIESKRIDNYPVEFKWDEYLFIGQCIAGSSAEVKALTSFNETSGGSCLNDTIET